MKRTWGLGEPVPGRARPRKEGEAGRGPGPRPGIHTVVFGRRSAIPAPPPVSASSWADPETAERIRKQPRGPGSGELGHLGVWDPAVCAEAMAAAAPAAAGEDGGRRRPGTVLDPQPQEGVKAEAEAESGELCRLRAELAGALAEMETMKAVAEVSESTKAEAVAAVQRQCQEEVASLQAILKDSISSYEAQITSLKQERQQQQQDCEEKERELGRLKQLLSRAHPLDSLEKQMEKAHEDSEKLREIVLPMEQEIEELKAKLLRAEELIQEIQRRPRHPPSLHGSTELLPLSRDLSPPLEPLEELSGDGGAAAEAFAHNCDDSASISSFSLGGGPGSSTSLPRGRQGLSPEQEETASLVSTGTLVPEGIYLPPPGYQLVPDTQWEQLQMEAELAASHKGLSHEVKRLTEENRGLRAEQPPSSAPRVLEQEGQEEALPSSVPELKQLVLHMGQEARAHQRAREHEAERLRIEIVTLREALEEETVARASLEGQLRGQREETEVLEASGQRWSGSIRNRARPGGRKPRSSHQGQAPQKRLSSQTSSRSRGQSCCGCRPSWRPASRCRGTSCACPRPCRCAWSRSARRRVWSRCAASWTRRRSGTSGTSRTAEGQPHPSGRPPSPLQNQEAYALGLSG
ncbi:rab GTPase-binding effector protein 2 isoform X3 [Myotis myotis]|uniref:rab GTPase-binding effector protein 2 isoform X3 n=1 Tax=Myotis myotis TaxID=51298 RepID=UPI00174C3519|nr:rab GTPase-binding effector protein 2 isoform X3 [Myotis myotis]